MEEVKKFIDKYVSLLPTERVISQPEAERRASEFLVAMAHVANWKHSFTETKIEAISMERAVYHDAVTTQSGKQITEKKIAAEADKTYQKSREKLESLENDIDFLKTYHDIFNNAHIFYRQLAKGDLS